MNNQYFEALSYIRSRPSKEKLTLFEYCFDRKFKKNLLFM